MKTTLKQLKGFDLTDPSLAVWIFKKSGTAADPVFTGKWIETTPALQRALLDSLRKAISEASETLAYSFLAQNNESSLLTLGAGETHLAKASDQTADPVEKKKVKKLKELENAAFYMLRASTDSGVLLAFRKTDTSWRTKSASRYVRAVFDDQVLDVDERPVFNIESRFDFFVLEGEIFIANKGGFEAVLEHRTGHVDEFVKLTRVNRSSPPSSRTWHRSQPTWALTKFNYAAH